MGSVVTAQDWSQGYGEEPSEETIEHWERMKKTLSEVYPHLFVSGYPAEEIQEQIRERNLHLGMIVSLTHASPPHLGVPIARYPFSDTVHDIDLVTAMAARNRVVDELRKGHDVLVHCAYGLNRAPLVAALAILAVDPLPPSNEVIEKIRSVRPGALHNPEFEKFIRLIR